MRGLFPYMILASLTLHLFTVGGVALSFCSWPLAPQKVESVQMEPTLTLFFTPPVPVRPATSPSKIPATEFHPVALAQPPQLPPVLHPAPTTVLPPEDQGLPVLPKAAPEANPNAHLPECPAEAVLNPTPPPVLDGTKGVVFLLDVSGSMYEPYAGSTRLTCARQLIAQRLHELPEGTPFAVILYAQRATASGPLVAANPATREAAARFLSRDVDCGGGTNLPAGLAAAAALHTGAIVLASDGDLNITASALREQARAILGFRGKCAALDIVAVAPRHGTKAGWMLQDLVEQQGGTYEAGDAPEMTASRELKP